MLFKIFIFVNYFIFVCEFKQICTTILFKQWMFLIGKTKKWIKNISWMYFLNLHGKKQKVNKIKIYAYFDNGSINFLVTYNNFFHCYYFFNLYQWNFILYCFITVIFLHPIFNHFLFTINFYFLLKLFFIGTIYVSRFTP